MNCTLTELDIGDTGLDDETTAPISEALKVCNAVVCATCVLTCLQVNHTLTSLSLHLNSFGVRGFAAIGEALKVACAVAMCWASVGGLCLQVNRTLTDLSLAATDYNGEARCALVIAEALKVCCSCHAVID